MNQKLLIAIFFLVILFVLAGTSRTLILGSAQSVTLPAAPALTGVVSQSLGPGSNGSLPVAGKDYQLTPKYLDNGSWVVEVITPNNNSANAGIEVLEKQNGVYQVVMGPGSAFSSSQVQNLPADVATYVRQHVAVYQSTPGQ